MGNNLDTAKEKKWDVMDNAILALNLPSLKYSPLGLKELCRNDVNVGQELCHENVSHGTQCNFMNTERVCDRLMDTVKYFSYHLPVQRT